VVGHREHTTDSLVGFRADTWNWHLEQYILIPPRVLREIDWPGRSIHLDVDRQQIESSPPCVTGPRSGDVQLPHCGIRLIRH
jgi:hypothetical protein